MKTEIPCSITIDTKWNRYYSQAYKPAPMPNGTEWSFIAPMAMIPQWDIHEAIKAHKEWNQALVNEILSKYY